MGNRIHTNPIFHWSKRKKYFEKMKLRTEKIHHITETVVYLEN